MEQILVFAASGRAVATDYMRFALVNLAAVVQVWIVSVGLARFVFPAVSFTWHADTVAHIIGVVVPVFTSYLTTSLFRSPGRDRSRDMRAPVVPRCV